MSSPRLFRAVVFLKQSERGTDKKSRYVVSGLTSIGSELIIVAFLHHS